ncbi:hypothetical protein ACFH04_00960 [Streptomyces noboritoensis]|uniref:Uncharacterized protein n=1 Tax=Streptomyces noboritoensis TaxID=67337 RepID=A0ABV6TAN2_9ACTN
MRSRPQPDPYLFLQGPLGGSARPEQPHGLAERADVAGAAALVSPT